MTIFATLPLAPNPTTLPRHTTKATSPTLFFNKTVKKDKSIIFLSNQNILHKMLGKKLVSMKKLAKKVKSFGNNDASNYESLLRHGEEGGGGTTPTGTFPVYVGEYRQRFVVPTSYLSHPLFKILLEKAYNEYGFGQRSGLVVPCSVAAFQEVISAVECSDAKFDFGELVEEFI